MVATNRSSWLILDGDAPACIEKLVYSYFDYGSARQCSDRSISSAVVSPGLLGWIRANSQTRIIKSHTVTLSQYSASLRYPSSSPCIRIQINCISTLTADLPISGKFLNSVNVCSLTTLDSSSGFSFRFRCCALLPEALMAGCWVLRAV